MSESNLFEQFQGADLDRLAECLKAIRLAGLSTSKHTQAGVNQNSGNVWVWDEDWAGCVYCSIGFDVAWNWSCSNCGEEFDFDTYWEMEEFASKQWNDTDGNGCSACCEVEETEEA
jgi:hypothetical protein